MHKALIRYRLGVRWVDTMNKTKHSARRKSALSIAATIVIVLSLALTAPASAVQLNMSVDTDTATEGDTVGFDLGLDIQSGERVPFDSITVQLDGPDDVMCTFALDGTPISGCDAFTIFQTNDFAPYDEGGRYGYGFDGTSTYGTDFGYGYGYGYMFDSTGPTELFWRVEWNTTGLAAGEYTATFYATASNGVTRTFNLEEPQTLTINSPIIPGATLSIDGEPDNTIVEGQTYTFRCTDNFGADNFDFDFGNGDAVFDSTSSTTTYAYATSGFYTASCTAFDTETGTTHIGTLDVTVTEPAPVCTPATEVCDGADNNCNGLTDEGNVCGGSSCTPSTEVCDGVDNDCDAQMDEGGVCAPPGTPMVDLVVRDGWPQNGTVILECTNNFGANTFDWNFGDGESLTDVNNEDVMHTYDASGTYTAYCAATNGDTTADDTLQVTVNVSTPLPPPSSGSVNLHVKEPFPTDNNFVFVCENDFGATTFDWEIRHVGTETREYLQYDIANEEIFHSMRSTGDYFVSCSATREATTVSDGLTVFNSFVFTNPNPPPVEQQPGVFATVVMGNNTTTLVVPQDANQDIRIVIPEGVTEAEIDLTALLLNVVGETRAFMPINAIFDAMASAGVEVRVPAGISIYSNSSWDGVLTLPQLTTNTATLPEGAVTGAVVEIGSSLPVEFDKGVRIRFAGHAGENVVYVKNGVTTEITATCSADTQAAADALTPGADCKMTVGGDLVVWTKHFTTFVTYTQAASEEPTVDNDRRGGRTVMRYGARPVSEPSEPVVEEQSSEPVQEEVPQAEDTRAEARSSEEAAGITGLVAGEEAGTAQWAKLAASLLVFAVVVASVIMHFRRQ